MKTFVKKRGKKAHVARWIFARNASLREVNGKGKERKLEKSRIRAKGRFGRLHCVRNMKIKLGQMGRVISLSREPRISRTKGSGFFLRTFQFLGENHPPLSTGKLTSRDIVKRGTLPPSSSRNVISRETCGSVCPNNVARDEVETLPFSRDGNYISSSFSYHPVIARRRFVRRREGNLVEELGPWN